MRIRIAADDLYDKVKDDIERALLSYLNQNVTTPLLTDIQGNVMNYIQDIAPEDFGIFFKVTSVSAGQNGQVEIVFEPTDFFMMKVIKEYYESKP